MPILDNTRL